MRIVNTDVYKEDLKFHPDEIRIENGLFAETGKAQEGEEIFDGGGCYAIPGLIDIHFHGAMGYDVCDASVEAYERIAEYEASVGVTAICPATLTLPAEDLEHVLSAGLQYASKQHENASELTGFNMEGPFISHIKKGAQREDCILPCDTDLAERFIQASGGLVKIIGVAPEENPDHAAFTDKLIRDGICVALAHTNADYETASEAIRAGVSHAVHLYNAMSGMTHRDPGTVGAVFDSDSVTAELICDGIHVHPAAVRAAFALLGEERTILISDSLRCTGMPDGRYDLGGQEISKKERRCTLADGNLAGSVSNLYDCLIYAVRRMDIPLEKAVASATVNPARRIGVYDRYGSISAGKAGDLVLLDKNTLKIREVFKRGKRIRPLSD